MAYRLVQLIPSPRDTAGFFVDAACRPAPGLLDSPCHAFYNQTTHIGAFLVRNQFIQQAEEEIT